MFHMTEMRHTPIERATLAASLTARAVADRAAELVVDVDTLVPSEVRLAAAGAVLRDATTLRDRVILRELLAGATFDEVAGALREDVDMLRSIYAPALDLYRARLLSDDAAR